MNLIVISGNLVADPSVKVTQNGSKMCTLRVGVNSGYGENKRSDFFHVTTFGKRAEYCEKWLKKGTKVLVKGQMRLDFYTNKEGQKVNTFDVWADEIEKLTFDSDGQTSAPKQTAIPQGFEAVDNSDGLPF